MDSFNGSHWFLGDSIKELHLTGITDYETLSHLIKVEFVDLNDPRHLVELVSFEHV